ncbi:unnamed protein product, partial [Didymodactylos carnosus]
DNYLLDNKYEPVIEDALNVIQEITESFERDDAQDGISSDLLPACRSLPLLTTDVVHTMILEDDDNIVSMQDDDDTLFIEEQDDAEEGMFVCLNTTCS